MYQENWRIICLLLQEWIISSVKRPTFDVAMNAFNDLLKRQHNNLNKLKSAGK